MYDNEGNFWAGFALAALFNFLGILICLAINTPKTKKGALAGWLVTVLADIITLIIVLCMVKGYGY